MRTLLDHGPYSEKQGGRWRNEAALQIRKIVVYKSRLHLSHPPFIFTQEREAGDLCHPLPAFAPACFPFTAGLQNMVLFNEADIFMYFSVSDSRGQFIPGSASLPLTT